MQFSSLVRRLSENSTSIKVAVVTIAVAIDAFVAAFDGGVSLIFYTLGAFTAIPLIFSFLLKKSKNVEIISVAVAISSNIIFWSCFSYLNYFDVHDRVCLQFRAVTDVLPCSTRAENDENAWDLAVKSDKLELFRRYITQFPNGKSVVLAEKWISNNNQKLFESAKACLFANCSVDSCILPYASNYQNDPSVEILMIMGSQFFGRNECRFSGQLMSDMNEKLKKDCELIVVPESVRFYYHDDAIHMKSFSLPKGRGCIGSAQLPVKRMPEHNP